MKKAEVVSVACTSWLTSAQRKKRRMTSADFHVVRMWVYENSGWDVMSPDWCHAKRKWRESSAFQPKARTHARAHKDGLRINQDLIVLFRFLLISKLYHYQKMSLSKQKIWEPISFISACRQIFFFFFFPLLQPFKAVLPAAESSSPPQYNGLLTSPRRHLFLQLLALSTSSSSGLVKAGGRQQLTPRCSPGDN